MSEKRKAVPREEIPWYPTIDKGKCTECGTCVEFCKHSVFAIIDGESKVVKPFNCLVGCSGCVSKCQEGAIFFPSIKETTKLIKELRRKYGID
ncbi:MAG: 4Fe-4S binding protein [Thermoplasmata archaeon]|nr:4Fe-4S binding protein [Thermoplasmata archaeon]